VPKIPQFSPDALVRARNKVGFTREKLAASAEVPYETLRRYERGTSAPSFNSTAKLAHALGVTLDSLVELR
jgi:ribosome-binding protein aMBF1 (putative translation factor)